MPSDAELQAFFDKADVDKTGEMTIQELGHLLRDQMHLKLSDKEICEMFMGLDEDDNKLVTRKEFMDAMKKVPAKKMDQAELKRKFAQLDKSGNGKLDKDEMMAMLQASGKKWNPANLDKVMKELDTSGDGQIDYKEFCDLLFN